MDEKNRGKAFTGSHFRKPDKSKDFEMIRKSKHRMEYDQNVPKHNIQFQTEHKQMQILWNIGSAKTVPSICKYLL